ncbi:MAG: polysaccharide deacetylase family protein [Chloroflexota bacterium]|nr:polysaccharide deacetylase family protein [Chloroflexota bacterium]
MERYLRLYTDLAGEFNARPTLPITASVLARHPALITRFAHEGVEFAVHGLVHNDHAKLSLNEQYTSIAKAMAMFRSAGVPYSGFRGPYLRYNQATHEAVRSLGLQYHSSQAVVYDVMPNDLMQGAQAVAYRRALDLYRAVDAADMLVRPHDVDGLIDIPVAMPDDEIMVDRLHCDNQTQAAAWLDVLDITHEKGELFTLQLHPERVVDCAYALRAVLVEARRRQPTVWVARLDEIAAWWRRRRQARVRVDALEDDRYRVQLEGERDATLLVRGLPAVDAGAWSGRDQVARSHRFEVATAVKPVVGVSTRSPQPVLDFLREEGLPAEVSDRRERFGAYLDVADSTGNEVEWLAEIDRAPGPLVRLGRWPAGARSALALTGDVDSITIQDFLFRQWETRRWPRHSGRAARRMTS